MLNVEREADVPDQNLYALHQRYVGDHRRMVYSRMAVDDLPARPNRVNPYCEQRYAEHHAEDEASDLYEYLSYEHMIGRICLTFKR